MSLVIAQLGVPTEIEHELQRLAATYDFEKLSDKGSNGYLFQAYNRVLRRKVAIKFYFWADGYRAHVEPQSLARVSSPSIIEILEASVVGREWALFVTQFCQFGDVDRYLESNRFALRDALRFIATLLDGVSALHRERFVHRDLKPENILVSDSKLPLIADFGSVRILRENEDAVPGSGHAALYRPPESFDSDRYDRRGDLYQCGVVLYQVLGGRLSYSEVSYLSPDEKTRYADLTDQYERSKLVDAAIRNHAIRGSLLQMDSLPYIVPESVRRLIRKATAPAPSARFQSASEFMNTLTRSLGKTGDWRFENDEWILRGQRVRYRISQSITKDRFLLYQNRGNGWRRVPGLSENTNRNIMRHAVGLALRSR